MKHYRLTAALCAALMLTAACPFMPMMPETATISAHAEDMTEWDYTYTVDDAGNATITKYIGSDTEVTIPSTLGGKPVTEIGQSAFYGCSELTSVTIPEGVTTIGVSAFYNCKSLTSVTIPEGVTEIGDYAFLNCTSLTSVTIPASVTSIENYSFNGCPDLTLSVYKDSTAHTYAQENSIPYVLIGEEDAAHVLGDVSGDGTIDAKDASDLLVASTEKAVGHDPGLTADQIKAADVNKDDKFDAVDASYILVYSTMKGTGKDVTFEELTGADA